MHLLLFRVFSVDVIVSEVAINSSWLFGKMGWTGKIRDGRQITAEAVCRDFSSGNVRRRSWSKNLIYMPDNITFASFARMK